MAIQRRVSFLSEMRLEIPDMRSIESAVSADFDLLAQSFIAGTTSSYILRGFQISTTGAIGGASNGLQLIVSNAAIMHPLASQSGSFFTIPQGTANLILNSSTNTQIFGAFTPNAINYVGLDYTRNADSSTNVTRYIWDVTSNTETTITAPAALTLNYKAVISSSVWAPTTLPIAIVTTDSNNNVTSITDARNQLFRLGQGGASPNPFYQYPWAQGRTESSPTTSSNTINPFDGGDKDIGTLKDWMNAVMTSIQEIKGTNYWYGQSSSGSLQTLREDLGNTVITGRGHIAHGVLPADGKTPTAAGQINWDQDINIRVIGSELAYTLVANPTANYVTLTDDMVAYINLVRGITISPNLIFTNSSPTAVSVGGISWTGPLQAGDWIKLGSDTDAAYYNILSVDSLTQVTLTANYTGTSTGIIGAKAQYAFGKYTATATPSSDRNIYIATRGNVPEGQDTFWLFLRSDNAGSKARVYIRFLGSELEQGVDRDISDESPVELLQYIGSPSQGAFAPAYVSALTPNALAESSTIAVGAASTIANNQYFLINSSGNARVYYVWFNIGSTGTDPMPAETNDSIEVDLTGSETAAQVAAKLATALNSAYGNDFIAVQSSSNPAQIGVKNSSAGIAQAPQNFNVGAPFTITVTQTGTGVGNTFINDGDNLTLAVKKLDEAMGSLSAALDEPSYDETVSIVGSGATPPNSLNGPIAASTLISLPRNSRLGNVVQKYTVSKGTIQVYLNGIYLTLGSDFYEVGAQGSASNQVQIQIGLVLGDVLHFRIAGLGGGSGTGGGTQGPAGPSGVVGPSGRDALNGPIPISTKNSNYTVMLNDGFLLADCSSGNLIFTLPTAASAISKVFYIKKSDSTANTLTIQANGSETVDGANTISIPTQYQSFSLVSSGSAWFLF